MHKKKKTEFKFRETEREAERDRETERGRERICQIYFNLTIKRPERCLFLLLT